MSIHLHNIRQLIAVPPGPIAGDEFSRPPIIEDAALVIEGDRIAWFGYAADAPPMEGKTCVDCGGGVVVPGLIDCHTHVVFAGSREHEFVRKIQGSSYLEILESGGGIRDTVRRVREATEDELVAQSLPRVRRMLAQGVTTVEAKSGYGLSPEHELKILRAIRRIGLELPVDMVGTYLAAHCVPADFDGRPDEYLNRMIEPALLRQISDEGLAGFADAFCERGAFTIEQSRRFLTACRAAGLTPKIHAEQISLTGATKLAVELGAASADHLECIDDDTIAALQSGGTIPVLLPGCSFFLNTPPAPARRLIDAGLPVALATDCNPGSCMIESLPLVMSIACTLLRMTPLECLVACTANAAAALRRADRLGAIAVGHQADLLVLDMPNVDQWPYRVGVNPVARILKRGTTLPPG